MADLSRRTFLRTGSVLAAAAAAAERWPHALWAGEIKFPTAARERLAVASWPFRMYIEAPGNKWARDPKLPGMDLKDFGAMVVKKFGVHNIEPLSFQFSSTDAAYLDEFRASTEKAGARIVNLPVDARTSLHDPDPAKRRESVEFTKQWIDIAARVGSPSIRRNLFGPKDVKPDAARTVESLKELADYGATKNVVVNLENDNNITEDPFFLVEIIEKVNSPHLRALPDIGNSLMTHDEAFNLRAMAAMYKLAFNISHVKDSGQTSDGKYYSADVAKYFELAKAAGYRGYFSMEWEGAGEPNVGTQKLIDLSLRCLARGCDCPRDLRVTKTSRICH